MVSTTILLTVGILCGLTQTLEGGSGVTYVRWGKTSCKYGTQLLYHGLAAGSPFHNSGGGANYLCLPHVPQYTLRYQPGVGRLPGLYGAEYEYPVPGGHNLGVPCAVCYASTRSAVVMIPARTSCPPSWTREYYGYLMTEKHTHHRSTHECVDRHFDYVPGSEGNQNGVLFYHVEARCHGTIPCPPYNQYKELTCVVCTK